jgi:predicted oxidoreductase
MNKTTLSPIIAGTMNWEFGKNLTSKEMLNMIHVCLENKITTFDHADIYGYTTEGFGKAFASSKIARKNTAYPNVGSKCWLKIEITKSNITTTLSHTLSGLLNNR